MSADIYHRARNLLNTLGIHFKASILKQGGLEISWLLSRSALQGCALTHQ